MKNKFLVLIALLLSFTCLFSCTKNNGNNNTPDENVEVETLTIYTVNDFHGSLEETDNQYGAARVANYIATDRADKEASIVLSAGDMFQGSALSNYNYGSTVIDVMNYVGFDAMTIGNHEFDWNLNTVLQYVDSDSTNNEANFPFLGANILLKETGDMPELVKPYTIIERSNLKIGVIGYIGAGQEEDIAVSMVEDYYFVDPFDVIKQYSYYLRTQENCNVIIALGHDGTASLNKQLSKLDGDYRIDCIINGHTHSVYNDTYRRNDGVTIPCLQAGNAGKYVGVVTLSFDKENNQISGGTSFSKKMSQSISKDTTVDNMIQKEIEKTAPMFLEVLCKAGTDINRETGAVWTANALRRALEVDAAFINLGGVRANAFPIASGQEVTVSKVWQIMPFDNSAVSFQLTGTKLINSIKYAGLIYSDNITTDAAGNPMLDGKAIDSEKLYNVATIDFVFDNASYGFNANAINVVYTNCYQRDILISDLRQYGKNNELWYGK